MWAYTNPVFAQACIKNGLSAYKSYLKAEEYRKIYNRYAHINFKIIEEETEVKLLYADNIVIRLNYKDLEKLNIKYVLSKEDLSEKSFEDKLEEIYNEDEMYIYKVK